MTCSDYSDAIAEFIDGALDSAEQRALERHVEGCEACRALVADLRTIQAAAFTLDRHEPPRQVLESLRAQLASEPVQSSRGRLLQWPASRPAWAGWAAAAALILATAASIYPLLRPADPHVDDAAAEATAENTDLVASVQVELQAAEEHYNKAI